MEKNIFRIIQNETFGRFMVANRLIKQGELILKEKAVMVGPQQDGRPVCFKCCTFIQRKQFKTCGKCKTALICQSNCCGAFHSSAECKSLAKLNIDATMLVNNDQIITPLRLLLLRDHSPELWNEIAMAECHLESRRNTPIWQKNEFLIENVMLHANMLSDEDIKTEVIQRICGILDTNTFEMRPRHFVSTLISKTFHQFLRGVYLKGQLMAHDCIGNTHVSIDDDFVLYVHARDDIEAGNPIFLTYCNAVMGTLERGEYLRIGKQFECTCKRCLDPSELNTYISSLKCHKCRTGFIQPHRDGFQYVWCCSSCSKTFSQSLISGTLRHARYLIEDTASPDVEKLEKLHAKLSPSFHPNHFIIMELKQTLVGLYTQNSPSKESFSRKIELCQSLLKVYRILEPGISRLQGMTLYELHSAIANLAYAQYSDGEISLELLLERLTDAENTLKNALKHLVYEPKKSPEGAIAQNAFGYLKIIRDSIKDVGSELAKRTNNNHRSISFQFIK